MAFWASMFGGTNASSTPRYGQLNVQSSVQGTPVAIGWGTFRCAPNLIWYGDFQSQPVQNGKGGGKGFGKGGQGYTYSTAVAMGLCEGPLTDMHTLFPAFYPNAGTYVGSVWVQQAQKTTLAKINLEIEQGTASQGTWSFLTSNFPLQAIPYSSLAYLHSDSYQLGYAPELPNHSFEVFSKGAGGYTQALQSFTVSQIPVHLNGGDIYTATGFGAQRFTYIDHYGSSTELCFSPAVGSGGAGTLTLVQGVGPPTITFSAAAKANVPVLDANPADIVSDFLTNPQYSIGLTSDKIDSTSLATYRTYCAAQGLFLSPVLDNQEQVSSVIDRWASLTNTLIFWSEGVIKFVPLGDSAVTNTALVPNVSYTPDLTVQYDLTYDDFIDTGKQGSNGDPIPPITVTRLDPADAPNHVKIEIKDRANAYNAAPVEWQDQGLVDQFGQIDAPVTQAHEVCDMTVAATVVQLVGQRLAYLRNSYAFTLGAEFSLLEPGDIVTLSDPHLGLNRLLVRIKTIDEDDKFQLSVVAEEFPGSLGTAFVGAVQAGAGGGGGIDQFEDPGNVNPPLVFEPDTSLTGGQAQLWLGASGGANWASCAVLASFDGTNFNPLGYIGAPSPQGVLTGSLPNHIDTAPNLDTSDTLAIDTSESVQVIPTDATHDDADQGRTLTLLTAQSGWTTNGDGSINAPNAGELLAYGAVLATGTYTANLTYLRRGLHGMGPAAFVATDHFSRVELGETQAPLNAVLIYAIPVNYIGKPVWLKFLSMNPFGNHLNGTGPQDPSTVAAYKYVVTGRGYGSGSGGVPQTPSGLTATGIPGAVQLTWNANPPTDNVQYYTVSRATSFGGPYTALANVNATAYTDSNVTPGTTYYYELTATNAAGTSGAAGPVNAIPLAQSNGGRSIAPTTSPVTLLSSDSYVGISNNSGGPLEIDLPASPAANQRIEIADESALTGVGTGAGANAWTIKAGATTVGTVTVTSGAITLKSTPGGWQQVA